MSLLFAFFEYMRRSIFWKIDLIKGAPIKNHIKDISSILNDYSSNESIKKRKEYLSSLLKHATSTTTFYQSTTYNSLDDFPLINKNIIQSKPEEFESKLYSNKKNKLICTSGSTGAVLKIRHDKNKVQRTTADTLYFSKKVGFKTGAKLFYFRHWNEYYKKSKLLRIIQNIKPIEVLKITKNSTEELINEVKNDPSNIFWLGYASAFEQTCNYLESIKVPPLNNKVKGVIAISEGLNKSTKTRLKEYFRAPIVSRYSNMENGIIAQQEINTDSFTINWASFYVEVFKLDEDTPAEPGELGRIVITDLFNYCTPMIRYDTGDIGIINYNFSPPVFKTIEGRKTDTIFNTKGEVVSSFIMINNYTYVGLKQSQLIQEGEKIYTLKLNTSNLFNQEEKVLKDFKDYLGKDAEIKIEYVLEIPLLASGKRKTTINNYSKNNSKR
ncbi:hypothetical protein BFR04_08760 [Gaetbulibacter sp. 4G1]|nr:CoF synthetase [Gaetbulibacter sp. 4G1]PIA77520.1 hypothetical protein BFR04_08760 [Gaetbulibacter sp. 4G1]